MADFGRIRLFNHNNNNLVVDTPREGIGFQLPPARIFIINGSVTRLEQNLSVSEKVNCFCLALFDTFKWLADDLADEIGGVRGKLLSLSKWAIATSKWSIAAIVSVFSVRKQ